MFTQAYQDFFTELKENNDRDWFKARKKRYEKDVKKPFERFVETLIDRVGEVMPEMDISPKEAIFRIYRDTRFSKDKTPYKTRMAAVIAPGGRKMGAEQPLGMYIEIGAEHIRIYGGIYQPTRDQIQAVREAISEDLNGFEKLLNEQDFQECFGGRLHGEQHKRIPREFKEAHQKQPLIANKQFYYYGDVDYRFLTRDDLVDECMRYFHAGDHMRAFLQQAIQ